MLFVDLIETSPGKITSHTSYLREESDPNIPDDDHCSNMF